MQMRRVAMNRDKADLFGTKRGVPAVREGTTTFPEKV